MHTCETSGAFRAIAEAMVGGLPGCEARLRVRADCTTRELPEIILVLPPGSVTPPYIHSAHTVQTVHPQSTQHMCEDYETVQEY
jgi:hypothetical protein